MTFPQSILDEIVDHSLEQDSEEVCGLIVETSDENLVCFAAENIADKPEEDFKIDPETYLEASQAGSIKAIYHSHYGDFSDGFLGFRDVHQSKSWGIPYLLYHRDFKCWDYFDPSMIENPRPLTIKGNPKDLKFYLNWIWDYDRCDCCSLFRAYYKGMLDIEIEDYPRPLDSNEIFKDGWQSYDDVLPQRGFERVFRQPKKNDVILLSIEGNTSHHIGVIVDDSLGMLHLYSKDMNSKIDRWDGAWERLTRSVWEYKG